MDKDRIQAGTQNVSNAAIVERRISNAKKTLHEVSMLVQHKLWNTAINRIYYACFYAAGALLLHNQINSKTDDETMQMFSAYCISTAKVSEETIAFYTKVYELWYRSECEDFLDYDEPTVAALLTPAHKMISEIEALLSEQY